MKFPFRRRNKSAPNKKEIEKIKKIFGEPPVKVETFNLQVGMKFPEIYKELHGRVSGETSNEVQEFYKDLTDTGVLKKIADTNRMFGGNRIKYDSHEVVTANGQYAIIQKNRVTSYTGSIRKSESEHYIAGINDEQQYFIHQISSLHRPLDIESVLKHINRAEEGFTERLQGDILLKFVPYKDTPHFYTLGENRLPYAREKHPVTAYINPAHRTAEPDQEFTIELGRHTLLVKNRAKREETETGVYVVVESDLIEIMHPEHKKTVREIPEGHFAVLANQLGRPNNKFD